MCVLYSHQVIIHQQMEHYLLLPAPSVSFPTLPPQKNTFFYVDVKASAQLPTAVSALMRGK